MLIKTGAVPITDANDIFQALSIDFEAKEQEVAAASAEEAATLAQLQQGITEGSDLQALSKLSPAVFNQTLTMLEISGKIRPLGARHWSLKN